MVKTQSVLPLKGARVRSPVRELRSRMPSGVAKKKKKSNRKSTELQERVPTMETSHQLCDNHSASLCLARPLSAWSSPGAVY